MCRCQCWVRLRVAVARHLCGIPTWTPLHGSIVDWVTRAYNGKVRENPLQAPPHSSRAIGKELSRWLGTVTSVSQAVDITIPLVSLRETLLNLFLPDFFPPRSTLSRYSCLRRPGRQPLHVGRPGLIWPKPDLVLSYFSTSFLFLCLLILMPSRVEPTQERSQSVSHYSWSESISDTAPTVSTS